MQSRSSSRGRGAPASPVAHDDEEPPRALPQDEVAAFLHVSVGVLRALPASLLVQAMTELKMPLAKQAALHLWLAPAVDANEQLAEHFKDEQTLRLRPWRLKWRELEAYVAGLQSRTMEQLRREMAEAAKLRRIPVEDAQVLHALLFFGERERLLAAAIMLRRRGLARQQAINVLATQAAPADEAEAFITERGEATLDMPYPIWPVTEAFSSAQTQLFDLEPADGGDAELPPCFRPRRDVEGAGTLPVVQLPDGSHVVDTTVLEGHIRAAFDDVFTGLKRLDERVAALAKEKAPAAVGLEKLAGELRRAFASAQRAALPARRTGRQPQPARRRNPRGGDGAAPATSTSGN